jgi:hypothetical protein
MRIKLRAIAEEMVKFGLNFNGILSTIRFFIFKYEDNLSIQQATLSEFFK